MSGPVARHGPPAAEAAEAAPIIRPALSQTPADSGGPPKEAPSVWAGPRAKVRKSVARRTIRADHDRRPFGEYESIVEPMIKAKA